VTVVAPIRPRCAMMAALSVAYRRYVMSRARLVYTPPREAAEAIRQ